MSAPPARVGLSRRAALALAPGLLAPLLLPRARASAPAAPAPPAPGPAAAPGPALGEYTAKMGSSALLSATRPRAAWGAAAPKPGGRPHALRQIALHHTAGPVAGTAGAPAALRSAQAYHQRDKGWIDLAYHLLMDADGQLWAGRALELAGDTATAYDPAGSLLVCCLGDFEAKAPPAALVAALRALLPELAQTYALPAVWVPHRALASTACPGGRLLAALGLPPG